MDTITFDKAIEVLEITNIDELNLQSLKKQVIKTKKRWHPDTITHLNDKELLEKFTQNFQLIEPAADLITAYLKGEYNIGEKFQNNKQTTTKEPFEIIRENAQEIQTKLNNLWQTIKDKKYKHTIEEVTLSDGFVLKDLLVEDFKEDIAMLSVISFVTYNNTFGILTIIIAIINPTLGLIGGLFWLAYAIFCLLAFLPLSRFWLPEKLQSTMHWFVNFGIGIYNWMSEAFPSSLGVQLFLRFVKLIAQLLKYIVLFPLYEIAKLTVGNKIVGVVKKKVDYYANAADWYIEDLIQKKPIEMQEQELYDLSYLYSELTDVQRI
ncbi:MAG: hypothetical protein KDE33_17065 [Bacteroidetes bacterium]|nr:hypothetical protein [Bacteroidota bacterium]